MAQTAAVSVAAAEAGDSEAVAWAAAVEGWVEDEAPAMMTLDSVR